MSIMQNKEVLKQLDKLHSLLDKEYDEDTATGIINDIIETKLIPYICINLRMGSGESMGLLYKCAKNIKQFRDIIYQHIELLVMASLMYEESMKVALQIYEDANVSKFADKFNDEMIICIYKHSLLYPQNKELCMDCIRKFITKDLVQNRPFLYLGDEFEIIQKYFEKDKKTMENIYRLCLDSDSAKTFIKAIRYTKEQNSLIVKFSFPTFKENIKSIDIKDAMIRLRIYDEVTTFSRWDFIPFIFEEMRPEGTEWEMFRIGLYQGNMNGTFLETLIYYMEKYGIPIETLKNDKNASLLCSTEIAEIFAQKDLIKSFKVLPSTFMNEYLYTDIANLFQAFKNRNYKFVTEYMHLSNSNFNSRFIKERAHVNSLILDNKLGWDNIIKVKWIAFVSFTSEVIDDLLILDRVLTKYNTFHSIVHMLEPFISIRLINDLCNDFQSIKNKHIINKCTDFLKTIKYYKEILIKEVRDLIDIDLPPTDEWELPVNPTLEDYFKYIYQYSNFGNDSYDEGMIFIKSLVDKGFVKIGRECYMALTKFVPLDDIKGILRLKNIL
jgi:hypothetical protein